MPRFRGNRGNINRDPLAKIIEVGFQRIGVSEIGVEYRRRRERLLCGHYVRIKQDIFGETNATRRRCRECGKLKERIEKL